MAFVNGIVFLLQQIALGFVNLVLAPYKAGLWLWGIFSAEGRADAAAAALVPLEAKQREIQAVLSNSFGFGGTNACLAISKYG